MRREGTRRVTLSSRWHSRIRDGQSLAITRSCATPYAEDESR